MDYESYIEKCESIFWGCEGNGGDIRHAVYCG